MEIFRITDVNFANNLSGSGCRARWNSKGIKMLYFAESLALACLENAVHRTQVDLNNINFAMVTVHVPNDYSVIDANSLPMGWDQISPAGINICQQIGDNWIKSNSSLILKVPSVIISGEYNFLVNPNHADISKLKIVDIKPFTFDSRIKT